MLYLSAIYSLYAKIFRILFAKSFRQFGKNSRIYFPLQINGRSNISIGSNVTIAYKTWLAALSLTGASDCILEIGDGSAIGNFNHIYSTKKIIIGKKVLTADKVYISDNLHSYEDITKSIIDQPIKQIGEVIIGDGTWIGENVSIIGSCIGKNCVIGANSVVTKNIPDYSIAIGNPAKIIKRYNNELGQWERTNPDGSFIKI